jgi:hypothetical protein
MYYSKCDRITHALEGKVGLDAQVRALPLMHMLEEALHSYVGDPVVVVRQELFGHNGCFSSQFHYPTFISIGQLTCEEYRVVDNLATSPWLDLVYLPTDSHYHVVPGMLGQDFNADRIDAPLALTINDVFDLFGDVPNGLYLQPTVDLEHATGLYIGKDAKRFLHHTYPDFTLPWAQERAIS